MIAVLAQLVERLLAKQKAASSRPAYRTNQSPLYFYSMFLKTIYFLSFSLLISSCGGSTSSANDVDDDSVSNSINETCISLRINTKRCNFVHDGLERYYLIYTPSYLANDMPLLFALHGYGSSAEVHNPILNMKILLNKIISS